MLKITSKHSCFPRPAIIFVNYFFYSNSSTHPVMRRLQLFWMIPTCWKRRNAWKKSGECLKNRGKTLKWKGEISRRLPSDWAMRFWPVTGFYGLLNSVLYSSWFYHIVLFFQRKSFEDDRATWLKHQFLNITFADQMKPQSRTTEEFSKREWLFLLV